MDDGFETMNVVTAFRIYSVVAGLGNVISVSLTSLAGLSANEVRVYSIDQTSDW